MESRHRRLGAATAATVIVVATVALAGVGRVEPDLSRSVAEGDHAQVEVLLGRRVDPDEPVVNGFTPLMRAAVRDDATMLRLLIDGGADIEAAAPTGGLRALHMAAIADAPDAVRTLIDAGADRNARSRSGRGVLDHAAAAGSVGAIVALAEYGLDLDAPSAAYVQLPGFPTDLGPTPLATAARAGHLGAVEALLELGASVDGRSARGQTALLQAIGAGQSAELVGVLLAAGADAEVSAACASACVGPEADALGWARLLASDEVVLLIERCVAGQAGAGGAVTRQ